MEIQYKGKKVRYTNPPLEAVKSTLQICMHGVEDNLHALSIVLVPILGREMVTEIQENGKLLWQKGEPPIEINSTYYYLFYRLGTEALEGMLNGTKQKKEDEFCQNLKTQSL